MISKNYCYSVFHVKERSYDSLGGVRSRDILGFDWGFRIAISCKDTMAIDWSFRGDNCDATGSRRREPGLETLASGALIFE